MTDIEDEMKRILKAICDPQYGSDQRRELFERYRQLHEQRPLEEVKKLEKKWGLL